MEVMDLSIRKPHASPMYNPTPYNLQPPQHDFYSLQQQQYLLQQQQNLLRLQQQPQYLTTQPLTVIPIQSSVSHLGLFQQLQYNSAPQDSPVLLPTSTNMLGSPNYVKPHPYPTATAESPKDKDSVRNKDTEASFKPHLTAKRPFKLIAQSKNPSALSMPSIIDPNSNEAYEEYRNKVLSQVIRQDTEPNRNMRRTIPSNPEKCHDPEYLERRKKNNEAAKKSREARKAKEDEIAIRVSFLEQENLKLKFQLAAIERQKKMYLLRLEQQQKRRNSTMCF